MSELTATRAASNMTEQQQADFRENIGAGGDVLIGTSTHTAVTEIEIALEGFSYESFRINCRDLLASTASQSLDIEFSSDGGTTYPYTYRFIKVTDSVSNTTGSSTTSGSFGDNNPNIGLVSATGNPPTHVNIEVFNTQDANTLIKTSVTSGSGAGTGTVTAVSNCTIYNTSITATENMMRLSVVGGGTVTGTFKLYGVR